MIGVVFLVAAAIAAVVGHGAPSFSAPIFRGQVWWTGLTLGCLAVLMMQHLAGGLWGFVIRRPLESAARIFPLLAVMFVPLILGIPYLYVWDDRELVQHNAEFRARG